VIDFMNFKIKPTQSFRGVYRDSVCVHIFIGVSVHIYIYISICIYTVFLKNIFSENRITLRKVHLKHGNSKFQTDLTRAFDEPS
jgi:hypothetical protein